MGESASEVKRRVIITAAREERVPAAAHGANHDDEPDLARLKSDIEQTRAEMSATVDAIRDRFEPERLKRQVRATVRGATIGRAEHMFDNTRSAGSDLFDRIRENPLPAAVVAVGLGWLFTRPSQPDDPRLESNAQGYVNDAGRMPDVRRVAADVTSRAQNRLNDVTGKVQDSASQLRDRAQDSAGQLRGQAQEQAGRVKGSFGQLLNDNPLAVGVMAIAAGAAIGLMAPSTSKEHELMGEARDSLLDKAQASAQEAVQKAQTVAEKAASTVKEEASKQFPS